LLSGLRFNKQIIFTNTAARQINHRLVECLGPPPEDHTAMLERKCTNARRHSHSSAPKIVALLSFMGFVFNSLAGSRSLTLRITAIHVMSSSTLVHPITVGFTIPWAGSGASTASLTFDLTGCFMAVAATVALDASSENGVKIKMYPGRWKLPSNAAGG